MVDFDKLNRETNEHRARQIDRFNPSTRANYQFNTANPYYTTRQPIASKGNGRYLGNGQYVED